MSCGSPIGTGTHEITDVSRESRGGARIGPCRRPNAAETPGPLDDDLHFIIAALEGLPPHCSQGIIDFLKRTAHQADDNSYLHDAWYGALFRTGCELPSQTYFEGLNRHSPLLNRRLDWMGGLTKSRPSDFDEMLIANIEELISNLARQGIAPTSSYEDSLLLWADLKTAIVCQTTVARSPSMLSDC